MLRALAASALPDAQTDRDLYLTLRFAVMDFLVFVEDALGALASSSSDGATVDSMAVVDEKPDAAAAAAAGRQHKCTGCLGQDSEDPHQLTHGLAEGGG